MWPRNHQGVAYNMIRMQQGGPAFTGVQQVASAATASAWSSRADLVNHCMSARRLADAHDSCCSSLQKNRWYGIVCYTVLLRSLVWHDMVWHDDGHIACRGKIENYIMWHTMVHYCLYCFLNSSSISNVSRARGGTCKVRVTEAAEGKKTLCEQQWEQ